MPVSCENSDSAISSSIRDSLGNYNSIAKSSNLGIAKNQLSAALKQTLLKAIEYVESPPGFGYSIQDSLKAKYTVLRPSDDEKTTATVGGKLERLNFLYLDDPEDMMQLVDWSKTPVLFPVFFLYKTLSVKSTQTTKISCTSSL